MIDDNDSAIDSRDIVGSAGHSNTKPSNNPINGFVMESITKAGSVGHSKSKSSNNPTKAPVIAESALFTAEKEISGISGHLNTVPSNNPIIFDESVSTHDTIVPTTDTTVDLIPIQSVFHATASAPIAVINASTGLEIIMIAAAIAKAYFVMVG